MSTTVTCVLCGYQAHILFQHLREEHKLTAREYAEQHRGAPLFSAAGGNALRAHVGQGSALAAPARDAREEAIGDVFEQSPFKKEVAKVRVFEGFATYVPPGDDDAYVYDYECTLGLCYAFERAKRNSVWIGGPAGSGKSSLVMNVCRRLNRECIRVNLDSSVTRGDLIGDWAVRDGETYFKYGLLPQAMVRGSVLLLDEFDLGNPYVVALFRPVLEDVPRLVILENGGEVITPHLDFRCVITANTFGSGDTTGQYGTTHVLSLADRQRFSIFLKMRYLEPRVEASMLRKVCPDLDADEARAIVQLATAIRRQFADGKIEESISPRQLVNLAEVFVDTGSIASAADMTYLRPLSDASRLAVQRLVVESGLGQAKDKDMEGA